MLKIPEGQTPPEVAELVKDIIQDKIVCDIGCGGGSFLEAMSKYAKFCIGIEEDEQTAYFAASRNPEWEIRSDNTFYHPLPPADVYYSWSKDSMGVYLKAQYENTKGTWIFGHSERPSTKKFLQEIADETREINGFKIYIKYAI